MKKHSSTCSCTISSSGYQLLAKFWGKECFGPTHYYHSYVLMTVVMQCTRQIYGEKDIIFKWFDFFDPEVKHHFITSFLSAYIFLKFAFYKIALKSIYIYERCQVFYKNDKNIVLSK